MRIVIVGAGMAGLHVAESLRGSGFDGTVTLVGDEPHPPYSRPPLSKEFLTGKGGGAGIDLRPPEALEALDLRWRRGRRAVRLEPAQSRLTLDDGEELGYDRVVIATGAEARRPDTALPGVHTLRTVDDARAVSRDLERTDRLVVVGAGFIGAEVASSARTLGHEVTVVEAMSNPMGRAVHPRIGQALAALHQDNDVELRLGAGVRGYEGDGRELRVHLDDGTALAAPMVLAGIGVVLNTGWLAGSGVELEEGTGAVLCDAYCATTAPGVYAAGDLASWPHPRYGGRIRLEHWTNAGEQAAVVAHNLLAAPEGRRRYTPVPYFWSDQYGKKIQLLGQAAPADTVEFVHGSPEDRKFVAFLGRAGQLVGVLGLRSTPKVMRYRALLEEPTTWPEALGAVR